MLVLRVEYLTGVCMATRHNDPSRAAPEWPPHPDRLYSALVAAAADNEQTDENVIPEASRKALDWLAGQGTPALHASKAHPRTAPTVALPSNPHEGEVWKKNRSEPQKSFDMKSLLPVHRTKAMLPIPAIVPEDPTVHFIWPEAEPDAHRDTLQAICARVPCLGRSRSLVRVSIVDDAPAATHVPDPHGDIQLRVPAQERLAYLIDKHRRDGGKPAPSPPRRYRHIAGAEEADPVTLPSLFERVWVFRLKPGDPSLPATATLKLASTMRKAILERAHDKACGCDLWNNAPPPPRAARACYEKIPEILSGHDLDGNPSQAAHLAVVPLPFVHPKQRHADGVLKGLALALPRNMDNETLKLLAQAVAKILDRGLGLPGIGTWQLEEVPANAPPIATLDPRSWTHASNVWTSATPMIFGHYPKPNKGGEAKIICDSLRLSGIDPEHVVEIATGHNSPLPGAPPVREFQPRRRNKNQRQPRGYMRHVTIRFDRPVAGPLLLGQMRFFGLGLMRPVKDWPYE